MSLFETRYPGAIMSIDRAHRLALWREWDVDKPLMLFVGLNPSTANEENNDPTIRRLLGFARDLGCGKLAACNLFTIVSPHPKVLKTSEAPLHPDADYWIRTFDAESAITLVAWGEPGKQHPERVSSVLSMLKAPVCFKRNASGQPVHPLYQPGDAWKNLQRYN